MIGTIEQAIIDRIAAAHDAGALGYEIKKIASYGGELADRNFVRDFPAIWVVYAGGAKVRRTQGSITRSARFSVICGARSLRNEKESRRGSSEGVGSYQMFQDVIRLIANQNLGLDIDQLEYLGDRSLFQDRSDNNLTSIYGVDFGTAFTVDTGEAADSLDDFETFHANWDVPVFGNVGAEGIPDDDNADATDHVTLEI